MNDLRWILLGIGIFIVAGIYFWELSKNRRSIRSRVEKMSGYPDDPVSPDIRLTPKKDSNIDIKGAMDVFTSYMRQSKAEINDAVKPLPHESDDETEAEPGIKQEEPVAVDQPQEEAQHQSDIIAIYITAPTNRAFVGKAIVEAMHNAEMEFGEMDIFHYFGPDKKHANRALFSIANNSSPGTFDPENLEQFSTRGLAMFMSLPAEIGGDIAFEIMYDAAQTISESLGGELRGADRQLLDTEKIDHMRDVAGRY